MARTHADKIMLELRAAIAPDRMSYEEATAYVGELIAGLQEHQAELGTENGRTSYDEHAAYVKENERRMALIAEGKGRQLKEEEAKPQRKK